MTLLKVRDKVFVIEFRHATKKSGAIGSGINAHAITTCVVAEVGDEWGESAIPMYIAIESAVCSPEDQFNRHEGRLRSLAKCLSRGKLREIPLSFAAAYCAATKDDLEALIDFLPNYHGQGAAGAAIRDFIVGGLTV